jgi:hypothetical protein
MIISLDAQRQRAKSTVAEQESITSANIEQLLLIATLRMISCCIEFHWHWPISSSGETSHSLSTLTPFLSFNLVSNSTIAASYTWTRYLAGRPLHSKLWWVGLVAGLIMLLLLLFWSGR